MKAKILSALAGFFGVAVRKTEQGEDFENSSVIARKRRYTILHCIYSSLRYGNYQAALENIYEYQCNYGPLKGDEVFYFESGWWDGSMYIDTTEKGVLLKNQSPMTKDFFQKAIAGKMTKQEASDFEKKYALQKRLLDAWKNRELIEFHELIANEGANVAHVYQGADYVGHFTIWSEVKERKDSEFYKYFVKHCNYLSDVKAYLDREQYVQQLTA